jgi:hypothetical protein
MEGGAAHDGPKGKPFVLQIENTGSSRGGVAQLHRVTYGNASDKAAYRLLAASELDNFLFEFGLSFAFRDERIESFVDDIGDPHTFSLRCLTKPSHRGLV